MKEEDILLGRVVKLIGNYNRGKTAIICGPLTGASVPVVNKNFEYLVEKHHISTWKIDEHYLGKQFVRISLKRLCTNIRHDDQNG